MPTTESGLEHIAHDEDLDIRAIAEMLVANVRREYPPGTVARRDAHPKHHGVVSAEVRVTDDLPAELRHGVFATARAYPAWIRFSNGAPQVRSDHHRDVRGMAIKLLDVPGVKVLAAEADARTQDFVLASSPRFFVNSVHSYVEFTRAATRKPAFRLLGYFLGGPPWRWRIHELRALAGSLRRADDLLRLRYWSQTAYRLGPHVVKYSARPIGQPAGTPPGAARRSPDFLREALAERLGAGPAAFELMVQRQTDPPSMPIEDPTIEWDEARAPFIRVATITIPSQIFATERQMALAEQISYTPWHTLPEHAPLGGVNRARRVVYEAVSQARHALNGTPRREPASLNLDDLIDARPPDAGRSSSGKDER